MVHCIHNANSQQNKKKESQLEIGVNEELRKEMMLLTTKDDEENSNGSTHSNSNSKTSQEKLKSDAYAVLSYEQVNRLHKVIQQIVPIHGKGNFPTLDIKLKDLVKIVRHKLETEQSVKVNDIRLNGGAASHVLLPENSTYNDLDLIFAVDLSDHSTYEKIRTAVLDSLFEFLPEGVNKSRITNTSLKDAYIHKMIKVNEKDKWSLISLSNNRGRNVELKFVDKMYRQWEFSVDSFHIILDSLMLFYECSEKPISENIYPTVLAESVYGDFKRAFSHLENKLIATRLPEDIRGGGLLKYCNLLIRGYSPESPEEIKNLERYMCSRFFIDFSDLNQQRNKLESYLQNHFNDDDHTKTQYLMRLYKVVDESTVCLMSHERRLTLALIEELAYRFYLRSQQPGAATPHAPHAHYQLHLPQHYKPNQTATQFFPHIHHHLIPRPHTHYDLIVAPTSQAASNTANAAPSAGSSTNGTAGSSPGEATSSTTATTTAAKSNHSSNAPANGKGSSNHPANAQQSTHSSSHSSSHTSAASCKNSAKNAAGSTTAGSNHSSNQQSQQHIQQQYHAYLFGTGATNAFYYSPYHHHHSYQPHNGCMNSLGCQCGVWTLGCA